MNNKYKLSSLNKVKIKAAARKALMTADSRYYSWPLEEQEKFRIGMDDKARLKVERVLLSDLLGIKCKLEEVDEVWSDQPLKNLNVLNWGHLLTKGIGEDFISLSEFLAEGKTLMSFETLYDYDYADYLFQEEARKEESKDYEGADYYAFRWPPWTRLLIDDNFWYSSCTSVATHLNDGIDEAGNDYINELIPYEFVEGKEHGKETEAGISWDMKADANGLEGQLDELKHRWHPYLQARWLAVSQRNAKLEPAIYSKDENWDNDPHRSFIFNNEATLKKVRWRYFLSDSEPLLADYSILDKELEKEVEKAKSFIDEQYQDIMDNFDPNVIPLRKKMKIVMTPEVLEDLDELDDDE